MPHARPILHTISPRCADTRPSSHTTTKRGRGIMLKTLRAGAFALVATGLIALTHAATTVPAAAEDIVITEAHIARLKHALHLTPAQMQHWRPVEAALRAAMRKQQKPVVAEAGVVTAKNLD